MKNLLLIFAALGMAFFVSCKGDDSSSGKDDSTRGQEPANEQESSKPPPVGTWHSIHQEFKRTVDTLDEINADRVKETSIDTTEKESYRLTFKEDGTGSGSGLVADGSKRHSFGFKWELFDDIILLHCVGDYTIFLAEDGYTELVGWKMDEFSADKMVLSTEWIYLVDGDYGGWEEVNTCRYTFERVEEK